MTPCYFLERNSKVWWWMEWKVLKSWYLALWEILDKNNQYEELLTLFSLRTRSCPQSCLSSEPFLFNICIFYNSHFMTLWEKEKLFLFLASLTGKGILRHKYSLYRFSANSFSLFLDIQFGSLLWLDLIFILLNVSHLGEENNDIGWWPTVCVLYIFQKF
jgi:hypothetical protein